MTEIISIKLSQSNAFLIVATDPGGAKKGILVDTGTPKDVEKIMRSIAAAGLSPQEIKLIVLTHGHGDHAGGLFGLRQVLNAPVVVGKKDDDIMQRGQNGSLTPLSLLGKALANYYQNFSWPAMKPDFTIDAEFDLSAYGVAGKILPTCGHTAGSLSVLLENGEAIIGDLLSGGFLGGLFFPTRPTLPVFAENRTALLRSTKTLLDLGARTFYVGHGGPLSNPRVARWLDQPAQQQ